MCQSPSLFQKVTFSKKKQKSGKNKYIILKCMLVNDIITEYILAALLNDFSEINVWFLIPYLTITLTPLHGEILPLRNYSRSKQNYRCRILEIILISTNMVGSFEVRWFLGFHRFQQATTTWYAEASTQKKGKAGTCRIGWYRLTTFNLQKGAFWQDWLKTNKSKKKCPDVLEYEVVLSSKIFCMTGCLQNSHFANEFNSITIAVFFQK